MEQFRIRKFANAFVPSAQPAEWMGGHARSVLEIFQGRQGGLWVGGAVDANRVGIAFTPNALNQAFHEELEPIAVPATAIKRVWRQFGWLTGIVVVEHTSGHLIFRCFGAAGVARAMAAQYGAP